MDITRKKHHEQQDLCLTRPCYRQGRNLTAVKVQYYQYPPKSLKL